MFSKYPTYSRYRTLCLVQPQMVGEDVFALQTALAKFHFEPGKIDGIFGPKTSEAVLSFQHDAGLIVDGKAGGATQRVLALEIARDFTAILDIPLACFHGQIEHESGFRLGNYSPIRVDGSYDAGIVQRNTKFTPPPQGFDPVVSIASLAETINRHFLLFDGIASRGRRWALAQGAWNAPAFACFIAREEGARAVKSTMVRNPTTDQRRTFEAYVKAVSTYLVA